jgi:integrase
VDFGQKRMFFWVVKGNRPYAVPISDKLSELLIAYRDGGEVPPSDWVFPSIRREGEHIVGVKNDREGYKQNCWPTDTC